MWDLGQTEPVFRNYTRQRLQTEFQKNILHPIFANYNREWNSAVYAKLVQNNNADMALM